MTVEENIEPDKVMKQGEAVRCQWFSGKKLEQGVFPVESVKVPEGNV